jgi:electron transfer flavoprotein alpha subunit
MNATQHVVLWLDRAGADYPIQEGHRAALAFVAASGARMTAVTAMETGEEPGDDALAALGRCGVWRTVLLRMEKPALNSPESLATAFIWALNQPVLRSDPVTDIVAAANAPGRDFAARVASRLRAPLLQDCVSVDFAAATGEKYLLQGRTGGVYSLPGPVHCWTLRLHELPCRAATPQTVSGPTELFAVTPPIMPPSVRPVFAEEKKADEAEPDSLARIWEEQPDITEASVIISGGRALGSAENFRLLHEAAAPLHAAVGASRSAVDMGYAPPFVQVGQTGAVVSPDLYIACGISGSIFHTTGLKGARTVVAVNTDPAASIFQRADYGVTDDLFTVLPLLKQEIEREAQASEPVINKKS